jgi:hypothetical protein
MALKAWRIVGLTGAAAGLIHAGAAWAEGPKLLWEAKGFANPESVLPDAAAGVLYVSNVNGAADGKDGNGFISRVSFDGKTVDLKWSTGFNAPKGLALAGGKLFTADIDEVVEIDTKDGKVLNRYPAKDAKFLNDVAADPAGNVYISDMATNTIWRLSGGKLEVWLQDAKLEHPNGLLVEGNALRVAAWGSMTDNSPARPNGHLLSVSLAGKTISPLGNSEPAGHLDGIEPLTGGGYIISDWMAGGVWRVAADGAAQKLLDLGQGAADLGYDGASQTLFIPQMMKGVLQAYRVD